jgi:hypothetical protein
MSLRKIKEKYGLSTLAVAAIACVEASKAYLMESNRCLDVRDMALILRSLSLVRGQGYDRETVGEYWFGLRKRIIFGDTNRVIRMDINNLLNKVK